jgi:hypothetical protein
MNINNICPLNGAKEIVSDFVIASGNGGGRSRLLESILEIDKDCGFYFFRIFLRENAESEVVGFALKIAIDRKMMREVEAPACKI